MLQTGWSCGNNRREYCRATLVTDRMRRRRPKYPAMADIMLTLGWLVACVMMLQFSTVAGEENWQDSAS